MTERNAEVDHSVEGSPSGVVEATGDAYVHCTDGGYYIHRNVQVSFDPDQNLAMVTVENGEPQPIENVATLRVGKSWLRDSFSEPFLNYY